jgi:hypothetical protein
VRFSDPAPTCLSVLLTLLSGVQRLEGMTSCGGDSSSTLRACYFGDSLGGGEEICAKGVTYGYLEGILGLSFLTFFFFFFPADLLNLRSTWY